MARSSQNESTLLPILISLLLLLSFASPSLAKKKPSSRPTADTEIKEKKDVCYADIESGMWGSKCRSSTIDKENCALQCLSPQCYDFVYGGDPLEEGERDYIRSQEYKYCMHKLSIGESLDGVKGAFDY